MNEIKTTTAGKLNNERTVKMDVPKKTFTPTGSAVVLKMLPRDKSAGGVVLPDTLEALAGDGLEPPRGVVVSFGALCQWVKCGDVVLVMGSIARFNHKGIALAIVEEQNIRGIERDSDGEQPKFDCVDREHRLVKRAGP